MRKWYWGSISIIFLIFSACADGGIEEKSGLEQDMAKYENPDIGALSPRNGGYMDVNLAATPTLAVFNPNGSTIDFELWGDSEFTSLLTSAKKVGKPADITYTPWMPRATLEAGFTYYWRAKPTGGGWSDLYSFTVQNLCDIGGIPWAEYVNEFTTKRACDAIVRQDPNQALGSTDAGGYISNSKPGSGFVSLDWSGALTVEMGKTVRNGPGADIRVFEFVSSEWIEAFAGPSEIGPWHSMGVRFCGDSCDFDLGRTGLNYARYIRIEDLMSPLSVCHATAGADIDAIKAINYTSNSGQCG
ncbi:hypothetical protein MNBD_NITROSPINAE02-1365 [hydrothermal vent metagenome]|uniref:Uncharacterized protein n=1 Tax=hydrothermal vent metagenome TaxID=652676 RepID=A0A3B1CTD8_9ZZZZ